VRRRSIEGQSRAARRRDRRRFRRTLARLVRADAVARDRRLRWHYPLPRARPLRATPPPIVLEALHEVDVDARAEVEAEVRGREAPATSSTSGPASSRATGRIDRGLAQFREALINAALAHPQQIARLHPQYLHYMASSPPLRRKHPIATLVLVKLPLQLLMTLILIFNIAYLGAYHFFNNERLGEFIGARISGLLDGELSFGKLHWGPMLIVDLLTGQ